MSARSSTRRNVGSTPPREPTARRDRSCSTSTSLTPCRRRSPSIGPRWRSSTATSPRRDATRHERSNSPRPDDHLRRGAASALIGLAAWTSGDLETAAGAYTDSIEHLRLGGFVADVLGCSLAARDIAIARGRLAEAGRTCEWALRLAAEHGAVRGPGDMRVALADLALERGHLDVAAEQLRLADDLGERAGLPQFAYRFRAATARLALARGETERAIEAMEGAARRYFTDFSPPVRPVDAELARCHLAAGDTSAAMEWVREQGLAIDDQVSYLGEYEHVTLAMVLFATGHGTADLVEMLGRWGDAARAGGRWSAVIEIETLLAVVYDSIGDRPAAAEALERALQLAAPESRACAVLGVHPRVVDLLRSIGGESASATFARRLADLASARAHPPSQSARAGARLVDGLSERELDVLRLLRSELSGPEIARELHVSVNTLRTHTKSIYTKLGATSRREAVRLAAEYGY
ncbi:MAG: LuxR C-terminal-related transcriptional regulator [Ilumatobacteraceae bacterium]